LKTTRRLTGTVLYPALLLLINILIAARLFRLEYSFYLGSNEGTFIAIARQIATHPANLLWWPYWDCGVPFQNTYLPLLHLIVGAYSAMSGVSAALAFHRVSAAFYCLGPVSLYAMARVISGRTHASFVGALAFSLVSPCAWLVPAIRTDIGSAWNLRRLWIIGYDGEGPLTASLAFLPLAILFFYKSITRDGLRYKVLAGVFAGATVLANAFGAVLLGLACLCLLAAVKMDRFWRNAALLAVVGALAYAWISPLAPPSVLAAIRLNSPTVDGDFRFTTRSMAGVGIMAFGAALLWAATLRTAAHLRFFILYAWCNCCIVLLGVLMLVYIVPQPRRYGEAMDMGMCLVAAFGGSEVLSRYKRSQWLRWATAEVLLVACVAAFLHDRRYAHSLIQSIDITHTAPYRVARWMDEHMHGERVMVSGAWSFHFNDFTDTPQLKGSHDPMQLNLLTPIAVYTIYSYTEAGTGDTAYAILWLKALGAHAISVPGTGSKESYTPFAHPHKFGGVLPVLWHEEDDTIYEVPSRSESLAHLVPEEALVRHMPDNGLDVGEMRRYVAALDDPGIPDAPLSWRRRDLAEIHVPARAGTALSVQVRYTPGWKASVNGRRIPIASDGLGFIVAHPACSGPCTVILDYDGGPELRWTALASSLVMLGTGLAACLRIRKRREVREPAVQQAAVHDLPLAP
jgi:hypothetical protein